MCEVTKAIEEHPESQRRIMEIRRICQRIVKAVREHFDDDEEGPRGLAKRHA